MQFSQSSALSQKSGAHTQFKEKLRGELHSRVSATVTTRAGPSFEARCEKAVRGFQVLARASEAEQKKTLGDCIEKGRSRKTSAPFRSASETPNSDAMLQQRKKDMKDLETQYKDQMYALKDKMEKREPLFRLADVSNAFAEQRERAVQRKRQMVQEEHERWEHLRSVEESAATRPLLIENTNYRPPKKKDATMTKSASEPAGGEPASGSSGGQACFGARDEYEKDIKIRQAVSQPWFQKSQWAADVKEIKDRVNSRPKLHEEKYPNKGDGHALTRNRMMHNLPSQVRAVY